MADSFTEDFNFERLAVMNLHRELIIVGLGPGGMDSLTVGVLDKLRNAGRLFLRTGNHPVVDELLKSGINFATFDYLYERLDDFEQVYSEMAESIIKATGQGPDEGPAEAPVVFAVPGHPLVGEEAVQKVIKKAREEGVKYDIMPAMSFLDPVLAGLGLDLSDGLKLVDGLNLTGEKMTKIGWPEPQIPNIIMQVYSPYVASEVKLSLMNFYPDEHMIKVVRAAGLKGQEKIAEIPLYQLDRLDWIDHLTCIYVPPYGETKSVLSRFPVDRLVDILERLRDIDGCPWDREQTHSSLKKYMVEETYEVLDSIDEGNMYKVCEELGDLLLQIAFHAQIARENGFFDMNDVVEKISEKLERRHPHVFGSVRVRNSDEVSVNWEEIKKEELEQKGESRDSVLDGIPTGLPALMKADKIQHKAAKVGFDWPDYTGALDKVWEEMQELKEAISGGDIDHIQEETGDLLFAVVNLARLLKINAEETLTKAVGKFRERFMYMEKLAVQGNLRLEKMDLMTLDSLWEEAKIRLKSKKT